MTGNHEIFQEINTSFATNVRMGNGTLVQAKGKGSIVVHTKMGQKFIRDVLLVPDLKQNFLSVGQLVQNGYAVNFEKYGCKIIDYHGRVMASIGMDDNRNFALKLKHTHEVQLNRLEERDEVHEKAFYMKEESSRGRSDSSPKRSEGISNSGGLHKDSKQDIQCYCGNKYGHYKFECKEYKKEIQCYYCKKFRHYQFECYKKQQKKSQANYAREKDAQHKITKSLDNFSGQLKEKLQETSVVQFNTDDRQSQWNCKKNFVSVIEMIDELKFTNLEEWEAVVLSKFECKRKNLSETNFGSRRSVEIDPKLEFHI